MFKWLIEPFVEIYDSLRSNKSEGILGIWFITLIGLLSVIYFGSNPKELNLNLVGDAMGGIFGTLISTIVLIFVIESYKLQKKELELTRKELRNSGNALNEQVKISKQSEYQSQVLKIFELANNHIGKFIYRSNSTGENAINNLLDDYYKHRIYSTQEIYNGLFKSGYYESLHLYFSTIFYLEEYIYSLPKENKVFKKEISELVQSQISNNIRKLYNLFTSLKLAYDEKSYIDFKEFFVYKNDEL